jgi:hypothetical protein
LRRGQNYYGIMLVCVLVLTLGTVFMLAQAPPAINASLSSSQARLGNGSVSGVAPQGDADLLVRKRTGNVAAGSAIPCCANAKTGCGADVANCTYSDGSGLLCFSRLFDTGTGSCA